ncbi:MAG TPA: DNA polymerase III subunit gamma/tau [Planctomycetota bacterium]|nr:DNA polymerase III, subunit gamma and tau [Planctomycetota bacterium]MDP7245983.1 DNA polymerase III subunit gamma/tau [Planctomycetota bacterium]HJM39340.1 DNA polymerase III subunit gamma/tau [Planctomycetota bacterium]|tara:strand:+ start:4022 stop:5593 length:1572 start_codon:yes stop_codon:yes gene_type:complete
MSYRVLARKYRPRTFAEVIGQDHITTALSRAIEKDRLGQAYLLVGPRGVGKTSTARILAKSLNCSSGPTVTPCLECDACKEIELGGNMDVVEIDGASNNGVDDVRAIRERVHFRPLRDPSKVYIIDEVQRLSGPAFDALLKTLEEPPGHVVFLFATTDPHKIPDTITSRCQTFEFRRLREEDVLSKLRQVCKLEKVVVGEDVLAAISCGCRGGLRDAESMLDQLLAVAEGEPTLDDLEMVAGLARPERWLDLFEAVERNEAAHILQCIEAFLARGGTEHELVGQATDFIRDLLHLALLGEDSLGVQPAEERRERMMSLARALGRDRMEALMGMLFTLESRIRQAPLAARALVEWTLLRAARLQELLGVGELMKSLKSTSSVAPTPSSPSSASEPATTPPPESAPEPPPAPSPAAPVAAPAADEENVTLESLLQLASKRQPTLGQVLQSRFLRGELQPNGVELSLGALKERDVLMLEDEATLQFLEKLPGSPGPWKIQIEKPGKLEDPLGDQLRNLFGGREEVP